MLAMIAKVCFKLGYRATSRRLEMKETEMANPKPFEFGYRVNKACGGDVVAIGEFLHSTDAALFMRAKGKLFCASVELSVIDLETGKRLCSMQGEG